MAHGGQQYANNMASLMIAQGNAQADAARRKGEIWGSTMASLGQIPQQVQQMRQQRTDDAMQADAYGRQRKIDDLTLQEKQAAADKRLRMQEAVTSAPDIPSAVAALGRIDPAAALKLENELLTTGAKRIDTVARLAPQVTDQASHMAVRPQLAALGIQVPLTYTKEWWDTQAQSTLSYKDQLDLLRQQAQDRRGENQRGVQRMLGEAVVQRGGQPLDDATRQTMEGMALQEGVTLPASLTRQDPSVSHPAIGSFEDFVVTKYGPRPTPDQITAARKAYQQADDQARSEGRPYFIPLQTGQGVVSFDTRTGGLAGRVADLKPGETAQRELANAQTTATVLNQVIGSIDEKSLGPAMGRYKTVEAALAGNDPIFATFSAAVSTLQNTVIQLRTGAQMSEHEAKRILNEVPNVNLPPATFVAKAKQAQKYFDEWLKNRANIAYGRTTTQDVDRMVAPPESGEFDFDPATGQLVPRGAR